MGTSIGFDEDIPHREWGYSFIFSVALHALMFALAVLVTNLSSFSSSQYAIEPAYTVHLVDVPLSGKGFTGPGEGKAEAGRSPAIQKPPASRPASKTAATRQGLVPRSARDQGRAVERQEYEEKLKSLALKREAMDKEERRRREYIRDSLRGVAGRVGESRSERLAMDNRKAAILERIRREIERGTMAVEPAPSTGRESITQTGGTATGTGSPGGGGPGGASAEAAYKAEVWERIWNNWGVPSYLLKRKDLEAVIVVRLHRNGVIEKAWVEKKSGNAYVDSSAMRAVMSSSPFPPVPSEIGDRVFEFHFRPGDKG